VNKNNFGFTFIEVLISLLILSIVLLGLDFMHLRAMRDAESAWFISTATLQLDNLSERLFSLTTPDDLNKEITAWNLDNQISLPNGRGVVTGVFPNFVATVFWGNQISTCEKNQTGLSGCIREIIQLDYR